MLVTLLDVMLSGRHLAGNSLITEGTEMHVEVSSPLTPISGAQQLVLTELAAQDYLVQVVLVLRVELGEVVLDGVESEYVGEPEARTRAA